VVPDLRGVALGRMEEEDRLWRGMKDRFAYVIPERGSSEVLYRGRTYRVEPGTVLLKQPGEIYRHLRRDRPATFDVVLVELAEVAAARAALSRGEVVFHSPLLNIADPRATPLLALHAALRQATDPLTRATAVVEASAALVAFGTAEGPVTAERPAVLKARAYLRDRLAEQVRLDELADHVGLDKYHLIRAFRAQVGVPPYEFLTHLRILRARQLLSSGAPPAEVAGAVGYYDQSQLHRHFRRLVGTTPGAFARRRRGLSSQPSGPPVAPASGPARPLKVPAGQRS
jgi:AraC-like DNA-binding protein